MKVTDTYDPHFEHLVGLPVDNPERPKLRDRIPLTGKKLEMRARKFTTLAPEFQRSPEPEWWNKTNPEPRYPAHVHGTKQLQCLPFESGDNTLPGMEDFK